MGFGDGRLIAETLRSVLEVVTRYLDGTEGRGSLFLIWGGLVTIGFLTATLFFRTAVLGDLAPAANTPGTGSSPARRPQVLTRLRNGSSTKSVRSGRWDAETAGRLGEIAGRRVGATSLDDLLDAFHDAGLGEPRILQSHSAGKRIRVYAPQGETEDASAADCAYARGFLKAGVESLLDRPARATETACRHLGATTCEFEVEYGGDSR